MSWHVIKEREKRSGQMFSATHLSAVCFSLGLWSMHLWFLWCHSCCWTLEIRSLFCNRSKFVIVLDQNQKSTLGPYGFWTLIIRGCWIKVSVAEHWFYVKWLHPGELKVFRIFVSDFSNIILKLWCSLAGSLFWVYIHLSQWLFNNIFMKNVNSWRKWV